MDAETKQLAKETAYERLGKPAIAAGSVAFATTLALHLVSSGRFPMNAPENTIPATVELAAWTFMTAFNYQSLKSLRAAKFFSKKFKYNKIANAAVACGFALVTLQSGTLAVISAHKLLDKAAPAMGVPEGATLAQAPHYIRLRMSLDILKVRNADVQQEIEKAIRLRCSDEEINAIRKKEKGFEQIGVSKDQADLFRHLMSPYRYPNVPKPYRHIFQPQN